MKKFIATFCIIGSTIALGACAQGGLGFNDTEPPYTQERTASSGPKAAAPVKYTPAARTFTKAQSK